MPPSLPRPDAMTPRTPLSPPRLPRRTRSSCPDSPAGHRPLPTPTPPSPFLGPALVDLAFFPSFGSQGRRLDASLLPHVRQVWDLSFFPSSSSQGRCPNASLSFFPSFGNQGRRPDASLSFFPRSGKCGILPSSPASAAPGPPSSFLSPSQEPSLLHTTRAAGLCPSQSPSHGSCVQEGALWVGKKMSQFNSTTCTSKHLFDICHVPNSK